MDGQPLVDYPSSDSSNDMEGAAPGGDQKENENPIADNLCGSKPYPDAVKNGHTKDFAAGGSQAG